MGDPHSVCVLSASFAVFMLHSPRGVRGGASGAQSSQKAVIASTSNARILAQRLAQKGAKKRMTRMNGKRNNNKQQSRISIVAQS